MPGKNFLYVPGPTNLPASVYNAMNVPQEDHRRPDFHKFTKPLFADLKKIFLSTKGQTFIFPATGTGSWEVALSNTLSPGDKVLAASFGVFSHLWIDMAQRLGLDVEVFDMEWGEGFPLKQLRTRLHADQKHEIKCVMVCQNETTTGVTSDVPGVRKVLDEESHPAMLHVDGVSSIASIDFKMDDWNVDVGLTGSQKGMMLPAGLALVCMSKKALKASRKAQCARCFFDISDHAKMNKDGLFPYTPSIPLLYGLRHTIDLLLQEGLKNVFKRHHRLAEGVRAAVKAWKLTLVAKRPELESDTVTAIVVPKSLDARDVIKIAYDRYNLSLGAGLDRLTGRVFRIGHLGDHNELSILVALAGTEMALHDAGYKSLKLGSGVAAAQKYFCATAGPNRKRLSSRSPGTKKPKARKRKQSSDK